VSREEIARLRRTIDRERRARLAAEDIAEASTGRLYAALTRLEQDHQSTRDLAAAATHDIKTPLATMTGFLQLLETGDLDSRTTDEVLGRLMTSTSYASALITGLLDVLRAGAHDEVAVPLDLGAVLADVEADLRVRHPGVVVERRADGRVLGNPTDTRRLFENLAENAVRYAGRSPVEITIDRVASRPRQLVIRVGDNGDGIADADRERIFQIFQRGTGQTDRDGTGVGLAVAQRLARAAEGDLWLDDRPAPGGGAAFMVRLPEAS
jgi:signal transduction histidine kinase